MGVFDIANIGANAANTAIGAGMGILLGKQQDKRQYEQQKKLQALQISGQEHLMGVAQRNQLQMWKDTNYRPQMEQLEKAGLNPGLIYGMNGGGGVTTGSSSGQVSGGNATGHSGEPQAMALGMLQAQNIKAQTDNINADTKLKKSGTLKTNEEKTKLELENVINDLFTNRDIEGNLIPDEAHDKDRAAFKEKAQEIKKTEAETKFKIDENKRQELINNPEIQKIQAQIDLMKQQGMTQEATTENLKKEGQIKQIEIEWSKMGLTRESLTKFIQLLIMKAFRN